MFHVPVNHRPCRVTYQLNEYELHALDYVQTWHVVQVEVALQRGSIDNISVIVTQLAPLHLPVVTADTRPERLKFCNKPNAAAL